MNSGNSYLPGCKCKYILKAAVWKDMEVIYLGITLKSLLKQLCINSLLMV